MQRGLTAEEISSVINGAPTIPVNLTALALTDTHIDLAWSTAPGVVAYRIFRNGVLIATVTEPFYRDTTAATGVNYTYEIVAVNAFGDSSDAAQITTIIFGSATGNWWGTAWNYRSRVAIDSGNTVRQDCLLYTSPSPRDRG